MAEVGLDGIGLARRTGLSAMTISALICKRRDPKEETAKMIADVLDVRVCDIWPGLTAEVRQ
jgi:lambda repressor-like predicted transcriptional regulator